MFLSEKKLRKKTHSEKTFLVQLAGTNTGELLSLQVSFKHKTSCLRRPGKPVT